MHVVLATSLFVETPSCMPFLAGTLSPLPESNLSHWIRNCYSEIEAQIFLNLKKLLWRNRNRLLRARKLSSVFGLKERSQQSIRFSLKSWERFLLIDRTCLAGALSEKPLFAQHKLVGLFPIDQPGGSHRLQNLRSTVLEPLSSRL